MSNHFLSYNIIKAASPKYRVFMLQHIYNHAYKEVRKCGRKVVSNNNKTKQAYNNLLVYNLWELSVKLSETHRADKNKMDSLASEFKILIQETKRVLNLLYQKFAEKLKGSNKLCFIKQV